MNYNSALSYLNSLQSTKIELGLERIVSVCEALGHPEKRFPCIIVAGTNGKGSTCAFLESLLRHGGLRVGLYTSPHLVDVRERMQINREMISEEEFGKLVKQTVCHCEPPKGARQSRENKCVIGIASPPQAARNDVRLTYFEFLTAMAFQYFAEKRVGIAVLEVGLGGRFDATNIVTPLVSVITRIGIDHQKYLGDTIEKIAFEKCGIIKQGVPVVTVDQDTAAMEVIRRTAEEKGCMLHVVSPHEIKWPLGLAGRHQLENAALAVRATEMVLPLCTRPPEVWRKGELEGVDTAAALSSTTWPGRLEIVSQNPLVILDGAHNPNGAESLSCYLKENHRDKRKIILIGIVADKDIEGIIKPLAKIADEWVITKPCTERAAEVCDIANAIKEIASPRNARLAMTTDVPSAIRQTLRSMRPKDLLVITGSLYTIGEAKKFFQ